ncbi:hypothetical protein FRB95_007383, partial [Tulasnella sp. JGI-2019a]
MRILSSISPLLLTATITVKAALNKPCYGAGSVAGICVTMTKCSTAGGTSVNGACPSDPSNVKCCTKPKCGNTASGNCRWASDCAGTSLGNLCPGPASFSCYQSRVC